jgi:hypothetical protein
MAHATRASAPWPQDQREDRAPGREGLVTPRTREHRAKFRFGYDVSLDVVGVHFVGGVETTGVDFTQHAETAYGEAVHGYQPSRRPTSFGDLGSAPRPRPEKAEGG